MSLSKELSARGFIYQYSADNLSDIFDGQKRTVYLGIDPTADSIHVGHLVPYIMLNHILQAGHRVIILMGGGTALIGDPSFKDQERDIADIETIKTQCVGLEKTIRKITKTDNVQFVNNYDWLSKLSAIDFLRDVGKHFTVNNMIKKESVARRFGSEFGISYTEFSYSLLQGYDFYHLHTTYGCDVQIGGSDQWGNIIAGVEYVRRRTKSAVHGVTVSLITDKSTGKKFGKSEGNAVWLDPEKTSPFSFYQFWFNTADESVEDYLKLFTFLSLDEIEDITKKQQESPHKRYAQKRLAHEVTAFVHGVEMAHTVANISAVLFGTAPLHELSEEEQKILEADGPCVSVAKSEPIVDAVVVAGLAKSKREARTFVTQGAIMVDQSIVNDVNKTIGADTEHFMVLVKRGKKNVAVIKLID